MNIALRILQVWKEALKPFLIECIKYSVAYQDLKKNRRIEHLSQRKLYFLGKEYAGNLGHLKKQNLCILGTEEDS